MFQHFSRRPWQAKSSNIAQQHFCKTLNSIIFQFFLSFSSALGFWDLLPKSTKNSKLLVFSTRQKPNHSRHSCAVFPTCRETLFGRKIAREKPEHHVQILRQNQLKNHGTSQNHKKMVVVYTACFFFGKLNVMWNNCGSGPGRGGKTDRGSTRCRLATG